MNKKKTIKRYLASNEIKIRQCVYISRDVQQKIAKIVGVLSNGEATIGGYIDKVLLDHLNEHRDEINALYHEQNKNLI